MKLNYNDFIASVKTQSETSSIVRNLWISRSAVGIKINGHSQLVIGFAAGFDRSKCELTAAYELLERLVFLPYFYDKTSLLQPVAHLSKSFKPIFSKETVQQFLVGAPGPRIPFYGNGCAIFDDLKGAALHSRNELIERHICCEIWYKNNRAIYLEYPNFAKELAKSVKINFYTTKATNEGIFAMAVLECTQTGLFTIGSSIRLSLKDAYIHALSEVAMIYEDVVQGRMGNNIMKKSEQKIISLRDPNKSLQRKIHFENIVKRNKNTTSIQPACKSIVFEPLPGIYAARTFSINALDPRCYEQNTEKPTLPLF